MKNFTTKLLTLGITAAMLTCGITACNGKIKAKGDVNVHAETQQNENSEAAEQTEANAPSVGGWEAAKSNKVTDEQMKIFKEATGKLDGYFHSPSALLATQVVAGTNYAFLCESTIQSNSAAREMKITYIYVDPSGSASFLKDETLKLPGVDDKGEKTGGWEYAESCEITDALKKVMEKATETLTGAVYEPVAYIGSQVVAGKNHAILCKCSPSVPDLNGATTYVLVYVYEDLQGNCEITETTDIVLNAG